MRNVLLLSVLIFTSHFVHADEYADIEHIIEEGRKLNEYVNVPVEKITPFAVTCSESVQLDGLGVRELSTPIEVVFKGKEVRINFWDGWTQGAMTGDVVKTEYNSGYGGILIAANFDLGEFTRYFSFNTRKKGFLTIRSALIEKSYNSLAVAQYYNYEDCIYIDL